MTDRMEARAALGAMQASRARMAAAADCPPARHLVFGLIMGVLVAGAAAPMPWPFVIEAVCLGAVGVVAAVDRARKGVFLNGYRAGRTRPLTLGLLAFTLALCWGAIWLKADRGVGWAPLAAGAVVAVVCPLASRAWSALYRREMAAQA